MPTTLIRGGLVHDAVHRDACKADILLADGKIAAIGTDLTAPADAVIFDADGLDVFPGFVDAHTHIGLDGYGIGYEGCDYNEMNDILDAAAARHRRHQPARPLAGRRA